MMGGYADALEAAVHAARLAGDFLREEFHQQGTHRGGHVDARAEQLIRHELTEAFPSWGYRGEEAHPDVPPGSDGHLWLVDPNDGTSAFERGFRSSAVSIALLRGGVPVLGVVNAFAAPDDGGDLFAWAEGCGPLTRNGVPVERQPWPSEVGPQTVVLVNHDGDEATTAYQKCVVPGRFLKVPGIAYRLALVAAGEADACVSLSAPGAWDYAAGHALVRGVGGELVGENGRSVTYTSSGHSHSSYCFGGAPGIVGELWRRPWREVRASKQDREPGLGLVRLKPGHTVSDAGLLRRAHGALLGQLAGDSLGSLVEFKSAASIRRAYPPDGPRLLEDGGTWHTLAGQPTDDSELALMLARSVVDAGGYDPEAAAQAYAYWYRSNPFDIGTTTSQPLGGVTERDIAAKTAASRMHRAASRSSQSNGSLMRVSPLGIWGYRLPPDELARCARADSALTHPNPVCQEACAAYAVALAHAVGTGVSAGEVYEFTLGWARRSCTEQSVLKALQRAADERPSDYQSQAGWVLVAFQNAFYQLLHAPNLEEGVVETVAAGGDTDTNGAIAGALLGSVYGRDAVPAQWRQMVLSCRPLEGIRGIRHPRPRAFWPVDALELAERLLLACPAEPPAAPEHPGRTDG